MTYRKKTLRQLPPTTRRVARIINDLDSVARRLKNATRDLERIERDSQALSNRRSHTEKEDK